MFIVGFGGGIGIYTALMLGIAYVCLLLPLGVSMAYSQYCGQINLNHRVSNLTGPWGHSGSSLYACGLGQISPPNLGKQSFATFLEPYAQFIYLFLFLEGMIFLVIFSWLYRSVDSINTAVNIYSIASPHYAIEAHL